MPDNSGAIAAGAALGGEALNALLTGSRNKKQYERSIAMWQMQNVYNSPQEMMKRFQAAGLNPNLIYGNGTSTQAAPVPSAEVETPHIDIGKGANAYFDANIKKIQTDNLKAQNTLLLEDALLKRAQTRATLANAGLGEYSLDFKKSTRFQQEQSAWENLENISSRNRNLKMDALFKEQTFDDRKQGVRFTNDLRSAQLENIKQNILNSEQRRKLNEFEIELNKNGITRNSNTFLKMVATFLNNSIGINLSNYGSGK